jgi:putative peptide zinc metalloprotease protein
MDNVNAGRYEVESTAAQKPRKDVSGRWSTAQARAKTYLLNTAVDILLLDMGNRARMYQLLVGEQRYQINDAMLKVLEFLRSPRSLSEIEEKIRKENLRLPSGKQLEELVEDYLLHKKIIVLEGENRNPQLGATGKQEKAARGFLTVRIPLFSPELLQPITDRLKWMYAWLPAIVCGVSAAAIHAIFFTNYGLLSKSAIATLSAERWIIFTALAYLGVFVHELGHASACRRFNVRHGDIGIGFYIIYPVFYTNVTNCWQLSRWQRAAVGIGGIYFQMAFSSLCCLAWFWWRIDILAFAVFSNVATVIVNLNPFLRFDGYWLLTDLLGVSSLHRSALNCWRYLWNKLLGRERPESSLDIYDVRLSSQIVMFIYSWFSGAFLLYFFERLVRIVAPYLFHTIAADFVLLAGHAARHELGLQSVRLLFQLILLLATCYSLLRMVFNFLKQGVEFYAKARKRKFRPQRQEALENYPAGGNNHVVEPRTIA